MKTDLRPVIARLAAAVPRLSDFIGAASLLDFQLQQLAEEEREHAKRLSASRKAQRVSMKWLTRGERER